MLPSNDWQTDVLHTALKFHILFYFPAPCVHKRFLSTLFGMPPHLLSQAIIWQQFSAKTKSNWTIKQILQIQVQSFKSKGRTDVISDFNQDMVWERGTNPVSGGSAGWDGLFQRMTRLVLADRKFIVTQISTFSNCGEQKGISECRTH